jgi:hypothetical protein
MCSALSLLLYLVFVAAYLENPDSHICDAYGRSVLPVKLEIYSNSSFRPAQKSIRRTLLYVSLKHVRVDMSVSSSETFSTVRLGKTLPDKFPIQNGLKQGDD